MEPLSVLGAAGSVVGIASFGLQLGKILYCYADEARSAKTSLELIQGGIQSTSAALHQLHDLLKKEFENLEKGRASLLFTPKALDDVKDTADKCMIIFWRIEGTIKNECDAKFEKGLGQKLVDFNKQLQDNIQPEPIKIEGSWTIRRNLRWPFITSKLEGFGKQLQNLQISLVLMLSIISLGAQSRKPSMSHEGLFDILETLGSIQRIAAKGNLSEIAASFSKPMLQDSPRVTASQMGSGSNNFEHLLTGGLSIFANIERRRAPLSPPSRRRRSVSPLGIQPVLNRQESPTRRRVSFWTHPHEEGWDPNQYSKKKSTKTGSQTSRLKAPTTKGSLPTEGPHSANQLPGYISGTISAAEGHLSAKETIKGLPVHKQNIAETERPIQIIDPTNADVTVEPQHDIEDVKMKLDIHDNTDIEVRHTRPPETLTATSVSKSSGQEAVIEPHTSLPDNEKDLQDNVNILIKPDNHESLNQPVVERSGETSARRSSKTNEWNVTSEAKPRDLSTAAKNEETGAVTTQEASEALAEPPINLDRRFVLQSKIQSRTTNEDLVDVPVEVTMPISISSYDSKRTTGEPKPSKAKLSSCHSVKSRDSRSSSLKEKTLFGRAPMRRRSSTSSPAPTRRRASSSIPGSSTSHLEKTMRFRLFRSLRSPIALLFNRGHRFEEAPLAYIIKNGIAIRVPHSGKLVLSRSQSSNMYKQSPRQVWMKNFAFLKKEDLDAIEGLVYHGRKGHGSDVQNAIVNIKKLRQNRLKFWAKTEDALLVIVRRESEGGNDADEQSETDPEEVDSVHASPIKGQEEPEEQPSTLPREPPSVPITSRTNISPQYDVEGGNGTEPPPASRVAIPPRPPPLPAPPFGPYPPTLPFKHPEYRKVVDITLPKLMDDEACAKKLTSYEVWTIQKAPILSEIKRGSTSWKICSVVNESMSSDMITGQIHELDKEKRTTIQKKLALSAEQQEQLIRLFEDRNGQESDRNFLWTLRQLDLHPAQGKKWNKRKVEAIVVYLCRAPRAELNPIMLLRDIERARHGHPAHQHRPPLQIQQQPQPIKPQSQQSTASGNKSKLPTSKKNTRKGAEKNSHDSSESSEYDSDSFIGSLSVSSRGRGRRSSSKKEHTSPIRILRDPKTKESSPRRHLYYAPRAPPSSYDPTAAAYPARNRDADAEGFSQPRPANPTSIIYRDEGTNSLRRPSGNPFEPLPFFPRSESRDDWLDGQSNLATYPGPLARVDRHLREDRYRDQRPGFGIRHEENLSNHQNYPSYRDRKRYDPGRADTRLDEQSQSIVKQLLLEWTPLKVDQVDGETSEAAKVQKETANAEQQRQDELNNDKETSEVASSSGDIETSVPTSGKTTELRGRASTRSHSPIVGISRRPTVVDESDEQIYETEVTEGPSFTPASSSHEKEKQSQIATSARAEGHKEETATSSWPQRRESWIDPERAQYLVESTHLPDPTSDPETIRARSPSLELEREFDPRTEAEDYLAHRAPFSSHRPRQYYDEPQELVGTRSFSPLPLRSFDDTLHQRVPHGAPSRIPETGGERVIHRSRYYPTARAPNAEPRTSESYMPADRPAGSIMIDPPAVQERRRLSSPPLRPAEGRYEDDQRERFASRHDEGIIGERARYLPSRRFDTEPNVGRTGFTDRSRPAASIRDNRPVYDDRYDDGW